MNVFELVAKIKLDTSEYEKGLNEASGKTDGFGSKIKSGLSTAAKVGAAAVAAAATAVVAFGKSSVETGMKFDSSMSQVAATLGITTQDIKDNVNGAGDVFAALREKALEMGSSTVYSASEAAEGLNILAMSGYDASEAISMIEDVLNLAAAGSMSMGDAAAYVSGAMKGFNDETKDAQYYTDLMAKGATLANTSVADLGAAMSDGSAAAATYNQTAESMTVSLLRLAEQGVSGSAASTALAAAMKNLYSPTDQAKQALDELGVAAYEGGKALDFNEVVNNLSEALSGYSDEQKNAYLNTIFGIQGFDAYNKMIVTSKEKQDEWTTALINSSGEAAKQYATMTDNLSGSIKAWQSALEGLKIAVSDVLTPSVKEFVDEATTGLQNVTKALKEEGIEGALDALADFIGNMIQKFSEFIPDIMEMGSQLLVALGKGIVDNIEEITESAVQIITMLSQYLSENLEPILNAAIAIIIALTEALIENLPLLIDAAIQILEAILNYLSDNTDKVIEAGVALVEALARGIVDTYWAIVDVVAEIIEKGLWALIETYEEWTEKGREIVEKVSDGIKNKFSHFVDTLKDMVQKGKEGIKSLFNEILQTGQEMIDKFNEGVKNKFDSVVSVGKDIINKVKEGVTSLIDSARSWGSDLISNFRQGIENAMQSLLNTVSNMAAKIKSFLHFSEPDVGPLSDFHTYAPDMMKLFAQGIKDNTHIVTDQVKKSFDFGGDIIGTAVETGGAAGNRYNSSSVVNIYPQNLSEAQIDYIFNKINVRMGGSIA